LFAHVILADDRRKILCAFIITPAFCTDFYIVELHLRGSRWFQFDGLPIGLESKSEKSPHQADKKLAALAKNVVDCRHTNLTYRGHRSDKLTEYPIISAISLTRLMSTSRNSLSTPLGIAVAPGADDDARCSEQGGKLGDAAEVSFEQRETKPLLKQPNSPA
jgi:hypothetical protein